MDTLSLNNLLVFLRGLSFNDREWLASRMFLPQEKTLAADRLYDPESGCYLNEETMQAIRDVEAGNVIKCNNVDELFADL